MKVCSINSFGFQGLSWMINGQKHLLSWEQTVEQESLARVEVNKWANIRNSTWDSKAINNVAYTLNLKEAKMVDFLISQKKTLYIVLNTLTGGINPDRSASLFNSINGSSGF